MQPIPLNTPEYIVELWDINGVYIMDISDIIASSLRITMEVNATEDIQLLIDLVQFEQRCAAIGANPRSVLEPYRTDIRIRRNGTYLCGGQVVQTNINFNQQENNRIEINCTGYLNYFKDRFMTAYYRNMTYAQIARQLIIDSQSVPNLISNSQFYEDVGGWSPANSGYVSWDQVEGHDAAGSLYSANSLGGVAEAGARASIGFLAGVSYQATFWLKTTVASGNIFVTTETGIKQGITPVTNTNWNQYTISWTQGTASNYFDIKSDAGTTVNFYLDDVRVISSLDLPAYFDFGITMGVDTASPLQQDDRERTYDIQNVKQNIQNVTKLDEDNFDFEFTAEKVFNTYARLGTDRPDFELVYPQNITSIQVERDASTLANRIIGLGSGIGKERLETIATSYTSATAFRIRERTETFNGVKEQSTLDANTLGVLNDYQDIYEIPNITVEANNLDLDDIHLGDAINIRVDGSTFVTSINGMYRIMKMSIDINMNHDEKINLDMVRW